VPWYSRFRHLHDIDAVQHLTSLRWRGRLATLWKLTVYTVLFNNNKATLCFWPPKIVTPVFVLGLVRRVYLLELGIVAFWLTYDQNQTTALRSFGKLNWDISFEIVMACFMIYSPHRSSSHPWFFWSKKKLQVLMTLHYNTKSERKVTSVDDLLLGKEKNPDHRRIC
jgi:hypothetical protein